MKHSRRLLAAATIGATLLAPVASLAASDSMMMGDSMMKSDTMMQSGNMMMKAKTGVMVGGAMMVPNLNIVQNAVNAKNVTTVVAAVKAAGLVDTLSGTGPFTVFAPDNTAFARLPAGTVATLLKPENKDKLAGILTYHVVSGRYTAADLKNGMNLKTVNGQELKIKKVGRNIWINDARVQTRDVVSSNGVTFVINRVLMPK